MEVRDRDRQMARNDNERRYLSSVSLRRGGCLVEEVRDRERQKNEKTASIKCLSKFLSLSLALSLSLFLSVFLGNHTSVYLSLALPLDINMVLRRLVWGCLENLVRAWQNVRIVVRKIRIVVGGVCKV